MSFAAMMLVGFVIDLCIGWPRALFARIGHPVTWLGAVISWLETRLNTGTGQRRFLTGTTCTVLSILAALIPSVALQWALPDGPLGWLIGGALAWPLIATRAMHDHVAAVARPLIQGDLPGARHAVSMIVGRDPAQLDTPAIARAATESLAENTSDGIVAPVFWGVVAGLPGIATYKAINTLDSMIGHRNDRYEQFGKVAARLDDLVNLVPARLTGGVFALAALRHMPRALRVMLRDAGQHRSPNAGWPEGAMAGALGIRLSGPRIYGTERVEDPWLNAGMPDPTPQDLSRALSLYRRAMACLALALLALSLF
ncbi:adenosylcobinamide-phosphate synthase CbiB [Primorskyibacter aestuariivivens]|uniref:adenosylcobinamide-phosphate synthase CbiB n=1 Tax=Primorskyibacter aestuariivivens TaxID=1888912 RepID=UPI002301C617|nr:adenosylcobinamide-phosphate synthase CbiB [Primorskyibacter aestuariivivens]MDA7428006.1 adenosylcobinamide-phosphate synthase CbiB [Primorskyibacter aestuariivivens]